MQFVWTSGVSVLVLGGWHEARIPTIAAMVPRGAFQFLAKRLKERVSIPVICSNRINTPDIAEKILEQGCADLVSMARPCLLIKFSYKSTKWQRR